MTSSSRRGLDAPPSRGSHASKKTAQLEHALLQVLERQSINKAGPSSTLELCLHDLIPEVVPEVAATLASTIGRDAAAVAVVSSCDAGRVLREVFAAVTADLVAATSCDDISCYAVADASLRAPRVKPFRRTI